MTGSSPKVARQIVQKLIDLFVEQIWRATRDETTQSLGFLDAQLEQRHEAVTGGRGQARRFPEPLSRIAARHGSLTDRMGTVKPGCPRSTGDLAAA